MRSKREWRSTGRDDHYGKANGVNEIIDLELLAAWPIDLITYLETNRLVIENWERQAGGDSVSLVSSREYDRMILGLCKVLKNYALIGWHCTRLTVDEITAIERHGMQLPNAEMLKRRVDELETRGVITTQIATRLRAKNQAHETNRAGRIWFCFFPPHMAGEFGIESLLRNWGGEALYNSHDNDAETGPLLRSIGIPCIVEAVVPVASLSAHASR